MKKTLNIVKVGGQVVEDDSSLNLLLDAFCRIQGNKILVTGGGRVATGIASELGIESRMLNGRRITDEPMLRVVTMVYAGLVNKNVVAELQARGVNAIGLCGADMDVIHSVRRPAAPIDYGYVGDVKEVNTKALKTLIDSGAVPVLCPITHDGMGQLLNTNADTIAQSVASSLATDYDVTLTFCFEKNGVLLDPDDPSSVISELRYEDYVRYRESDVIAGGMIPKLDNAFAAIDAGVNKVVITNAAALGTDSGTEII
ncbi:MAG: acetylglutamate kinase [Bacteroidales bacterium]|nr:acetylglutamate kinase [Bacteroidales bacterium]